MMRTYCLENSKDWDEGVPMLLFAVRESVQESLGFSPFDLIFGHSVRGPLTILKEAWLSPNPPVSVLKYVTTFREKLCKAREYAKTNLVSAQSRMKQWYDGDAKSRSFTPGDKVLVLFPVQGSPLKAKYSGPYVVKKKLSDLDYVVETPDRKKPNQVCHINMLKQYHSRNGEDDGNRAIAVVKVTDVGVNECSDTDKVGVQVRLKNSNVLQDLGSKLKSLSESQQRDLTGLIAEFQHLFPDVPTRTNFVYHDVDVGEAIPVKQNPYRMTPLKLDQCRTEIEYMLKNGIIEPSNSSWSSPCVLVPKPDGSVRFCTDFRKVNTLTKTDSYPIPRVDDCVDRVGHAKFVTKFDLLKGYWQVPLTDRAKEVSAFVTPEGLYHYTVMPLGMKNAPATFQRLVNELTRGIAGGSAYIDDIVIYSDTWSEHLQQIRTFFERVSDANLTINLVTLSVKVRLNPYRRKSKL